MRHVLFILVFTQTMNIYAQDIRKIDSLKALISLPDRDDTLKIMGELEIAHLFYQTNRDSSLFYNEKVRDKSKKINYSRALARALTNIALIKIERSQKTEGESLLKESLEISKQINDPELELHIYANLAILHHYSTDYDIAVDYYLQSADIAKKIDDQYNVIRAYLNIGDVFRQNEIFDEAVKHLFQASEASQMSYPNLYGYSTAQIADIFRDENELDSAAKYIGSVFEKIDQITSPQVLTQAYSVRANILEEQGNYQEAHPDHLKSLTYAEQLGQAFSIAGCYCLLGNNASNRGAFVEASQYFEKYAELSDDINNQYLDQECLRYWSRMEETRGNFKKSNELLYQYFAIKDSIFSAENRNILTDLATKYEAAEKDAEIAKQQLRINQRTIQRNWFITGVLTLMLLSWFLFYRTRKNKRLARTEIENLEKQQKLLSLDYMVQGQEQERKRIAQELHDGLGGLLASTKLQIHQVQQETLENTSKDVLEAAEKMINHAHTEVRRIAHDMMPGALVDLGLADAIEDLIEQVRKQQHFKVNFSKAIEDAELSEMQSLHIYRIIQEILNNTIKHAQASQLDIAITAENQVLKLNVADDGVGFDYQSATGKGGMGLRSITSRVNYLDGRLHIDALPGRGTQYLIDIPL
ncbi:MAG: tetratricopeptide repeat protein [Saprospiraceae bacterium]|nr:tetratricopeptide repeat protein [Saprospiraceae bacterium]